MGKLDVEILEYPILKHNSQNSKLSVLLRMDSFAYMITDEKRAVIALKFFDFQQEIKNPIELGRKLQPLLVEEPLLQGQYKQVVVAVNASNFTIIPNQFYKAGQENYFLNQITDLSENDKIETDSMVTLPAKLIYTIDKGIRFLLKLHFPECKLVNNFNAWASVCKQMVVEHNISGDFLFVHTGLNTIQIMLFLDDQLHLANQYPIFGQNDFLYYIFLLFEQFSLDPNRIPIFLSGRISEDDDYYKALYSRVDKVDFVKWPYTLMTGKNFQEKFKHQFFDLAGLMYC